MKKRKIPQEKSRETTKNIKSSTRSSYNVMHEHNYFYNVDKKKCRWPDENEHSNHTEIKTNNHDTCDSIPDWWTVESSSDEEDDTKEMLLSHVLKKEFQKYLLNEYKNKNCTNGLFPSKEDQTYKESNKTNNYELSNISSDSSNINSENNLINCGKQCKIMQIIPLAYAATFIQSINLKLKSFSRYRISS
ncbi:hypothetical protein ACI65C_003772 [Semiaphis heraclei]